MGAIREESRVGHGGRDGRDAVERALNIPTVIVLERLPHHALPVRSGRELVGAEVEHGRIVQRPVNGVPRSRHHAQYGRPAGLRDRRLPAGQRQASCWILDQHRPLEDRQERPVGLDRHQELRAPNSGDRKGGLDVEAARTATEEMRGAPEQAHHAGAPVLDGLDGDLRVRIETQHGLVEHREIGAAALTNADRIPGRVRVVQPDRLPRPCACASRLDGSLD
jgi:hypothetical protein